jgi:hypothetical protein
MGQRLRSDSCYSDRVFVGVTSNKGFDKFFINDETVPSGLASSSIFWLFGSALAGLDWMRRKQTA